MVSKILSERARLDCWNRLYQILASAPRQFRQAAVIEVAGEGSGSHVRCPSREPTLIRMAMAIDCPLRISQEPVGYAFQHQRSAEHGVPVALREGARRDLRGAAIRHARQYRGFGRQTAVSRCSHA